MVQMKPENKIRGSKLTCPVPAVDDLTSQTRNEAEKATVKVKKGISV